MSERWELYVADDGSVSLVGGEDGGVRLGSPDDALALAERIRQEFIPDSSGAPGQVRFRQAWRISDSPHAVVVLHVQAEHLTAYELGALRGVVERIEVLGARVRHRLAAGGAES